MPNNQFIGTLAELRVAVDLMSKGYFVFIQVTHCSPFDLVAECNGQLYKIEVRTGHYGKAGQILHVPSTKGHDIIVAMVLEDQIVYLPDLDYSGSEQVL